MAAPDKRHILRRCGTGKGVEPAHAVRSAEIGGTNPFHIRQVGNRVDIGKRNPRPNRPVRMGYVNDLAGNVINLLQDRTEKMIVDLNK